MTPVVKWRELDDKLKCQNPHELGQPSKTPVQDDLHPAADYDSDDKSETVAELQSLLGDLSLRATRAAGRCVLLELAQLVRPVENPRVRGAWRPFRLGRLG